MSRFASCSLGERRFAALVEGDTVRPLAGIAELGRETPSDVLADPPLSDERVPLGDVTLLPVVPHPGKVVCVGLNYKAHVEEGVIRRPGVPGAVLEVRRDARRRRRAGAAAARVGGGRLRGRAGVRDRPARSAGSAATRRSPRSRGYTVANDVTMRDYQYSTHQWLPGKNWASSTPLGPFLVTPDEVGDPHSLDISLELNGERMQESNTSLFIFDIPTLVATISEFVPLAPGDVVLTGTPSGVGYRRDPKVLLRDGDRMVVEVERVGRLENPVAAE